MTAVQALAVLLVRFWAVGALIAWLVNFTISIQVFATGQVGDEKGMTGYLTLASSFFSVIFWSLILFFSRTVTGWVLPPVEGNEPEFRIKPAEIIRMGTFLIGIFYLMKYVPEMLRALLSITIPRLANGRQELALSLDLVSLAPYFVAIFVALALFLRPAGAARFFSWLRRVGQAPVTPQESRINPDRKEIDPGGDRP